MHGFLVNLEFLGNASLSMLPRLGTDRTRLGGTEYRRGVVLHNTEYAYGARWLGFPKVQRSKSLHANMPTHWITTRQQVKATVSYGNCQL